MNPSEDPECPSSSPHPRQCLCKECMEAFGTFQYYNQMLQQEKKKANQELTRKMSMQQSKRNLSRNSVKSSEKKALVSSVFMFRDRNTLVNCQVQWIHFRLSFLCLNKFWIKIRGIIISFAQFTTGQHLHMKYFTWNQFCNGALWIVNDRIKKVLCVVLLNNNILINGYFVL